MSLDKYQDTLNYLKEARNEINALRNGWSTQTYDNLLINMLNILLVVESLILDSTKEKDIQ